MSKTMQSTFTLAILVMAIAGFSAPSTARPMSDWELKNSTGGSDTTATCVYATMLTITCVDSKVCAILAAPGNKCVPIGGANGCDNACTGGGNQQQGVQGAVNYKVDGTSDCGKQYVNPPACQKKTNPNGKDYCGCATGGQASKTDCKPPAFSTGCGASTVPTPVPVPAPPSKQ